MKELFKKTIVAVLTIEARAALRKYKPKVIAVTGSVGKTSTKDAIYAALADDYFVRRSDKSYNSEVGLPLTVLGLQNAWNNPLKWFQNLFDGLVLVLLPARYPEWLVLEVGADRPGDIRRVASWLPVDIAIITRLPEVPVHVEYFASPEEVIEEKAALISALRPSGTLILYGDDARVRELSARTQAPVIHYGFNEGNEVQGVECRPLYQETDPKRPVGMQARVKVGSEEVPLAVRGTFGKYAFSPALAALAVATGLGSDLRHAAESFERNYAAPPGRMRLIPGIKKTLIIDDTYNSSPAAVEAALESLDSLPGKKTHIAVLGDMLELGRFSVEEHRKVGAYAGKTAGRLITVGVRARGMAEAALGAGMPEANVLQYEDAEQAGAELAPALHSGDFILVKGSQSMRMERVVEALMEHPEQAKELLVRQDREWKKR